MTIIFVLSAILGIAIWIAILVLLILFMQFIHQCDEDIEIIITKKRKGKRNETL